MARFDVYANPDKSEHRHTPFVLDVQNDHIDGVETRIVIPLRDARVHGRCLERVHPAFRINQRDVVLDTPTMATFPRDWLRSPVSSLKAQQQAVQDALDAVFGAY
ncbi:CcdB family protein [Variovorax sp. LT1P1]|uniref:CcdB family protein n=1 Tax=Variovorax sp. LT1P1 TaxID=3443730 RepID=UPI003F46B1D6